MRTTKKNLFLGFLLAFLMLTNLRSQTEPQFITLKTGQPIYPVGMNMAWINQGNWNNTDWGGEITLFDEARFTQIIKQIAASGANSARWWLHFTGEYSPQFDANGFCSGFNPIDTVNLHRALDIAWANGITICMTLWSIDMLDADQGFDIQRNIDLIMDRAHTMAYINNALIPIVKKFKNHPAVLCWEIMNEPEGGIPNFGGSAGWQDGEVTSAGIQQFVNLTAGAINRTDAVSPVTVGSWSFYAMSDIFKSGYSVAYNYYNPDSLKARGGDPDGTLDFYQVHYYPDWFHADRSPFHNPSTHWQLDKPVMIGEFPAIGLPNSFDGIEVGEEMTPAQCWEYAFQNGYLGAYAWSEPIHNDRYGGLSDALPGIQYMLQNHRSVVKVQQNFNPKFPLVKWESNDLTVYPNSTFQLTASAIGENISYNWYLNDVFYKAGRTITANSNDIIKGKSDGEKEIGYFKCKVSNNLGFVYSNIVEATLTAEKATIITNPVDASVSVGSSASFNVVIAKNSIYTYDFEWYLNGTKIVPTAGKYTVTNTTIGNTIKSVLTIVKVDAAGADDAIQAKIFTKFTKSGKLLYTVNTKSAYAFLNRTYNCTTTVAPIAANFVTGNDYGVDGWVITNANNALHLAGRSWAKDEFWLTNTEATYVNKGQAIKVSFTLNDSEYPVTSLQFGLVYAVSAKSPQTIATPATMTKNGTTWTATFISPSAGTYYKAIHFNYVQTGIAIDYDISNLQVCMSNSSATYSITANAGAHGTITPAGITSADMLGNVSYTISPTTNYKIQDVLVDGVSKGAITTFAFQSILANHTISATFAANVAPGITLLEAEEAALSGDLSVEPNPLVSNNAYVNMRGYNAANNPTITWNVTVPQAGIYTITVGFNAVYGYKEESLIVNGAWLGNIPFNEPANVWQTTTLDVSLLAGNNTVTFSASWGWLYFDYISLNTSTFKSASDNVNLTNNDAVLQNSVEMYPNPVSDYLNININVAKEAAEAQIRIFNNLGQLVLTQPFGSLNNGLNKLELPIKNSSSITNGLYFYVVSVGDEKFTGKLIVE